MATIETRPDGGRYVALTAQEAAGVRRMAARALSRPYPRWLILALALVAVAVTDTPAAVKFIHPKRTILMSGPGGIDVPVQAFVEPHPDNRVVRLTWDGETCGGASSKTLDGEYDRALVPVQPILVRLYPGVCAFSAHVYGPGGAIRARARLAVTVCGGPEDCAPGG